MSLLGSFTLGAHLVNYASAAAWQPITTDTFDPVAILGSWAHSQALSKVLFKNQRYAHLCLNGTMAKYNTVDGERVFSLPVHLSSTWIFNCYAIEGEDGQTVLVDPGLLSTTQKALRHLHSIGRDPTGLHSVCTHGHVDHVGGMPLLRRQVGAQTYLPARCEKYLEGERPRTFDSKTALRFFPMVRQQPFVLRSLAELAKASRSIGFAGASESFQFPFKPDGFLAEGTVLPGAKQWRVLSVPGHSDDSICFYNADSRTLISGDAVLTHNGRAWFNPEIVDADESAQTEERLRDLDVEHLLPGHGLPISGQVWKNALSFRERPPARGLVARCLRHISK